MKKKPIIDLSQLWQRNKKTMIIMKLIAMIMTITVYQAAGSLYSQNTTFSFQLNNVPIKSVLQEIENTSEFKFLYRTEFLDVDRTVNVTAKNDRVETILDNIFTAPDFTYRVFEDNLIVITNNQMLQPRQKSVSGTVTDASTGSPLPGVNVVIKGTAIGTITDINGSFRINVSVDDQFLVFSFVGMESQEVDISNQTELTVNLRGGAIDIEEVIAIGYGFQKKANLTGAVDVVTNRQIENRQASTVSQLLQGLTPALSFSVNRDGFQPGAEVEIDIRGIGSLNGGEPYVLIDGYPGDINRLNPEDIESISVMKDAASSAIYGARAPFGVILVTTKSGRKNEKMTATYSGGIIVNTPLPMPKMLDSWTAARVYNEAGENRGGRRFTNARIDRIIAYQNGDFEYLKQFLPPDAIYFEDIDLGDNSFGESHANYDYFDVFYGHSVNQKHNFSVQGGSEKSAYYFSAGYMDQEGVIKFGEDTYNRINLTGKLNTAITSWWDFRYEPRFMKSFRERPNSGRGNYDISFHQILRTHPTVNVYDAFGNYTSGSKILPLTDGGTDRIERTENWQTFATEIRPLKGWKINADFAYKSFDQYGNNARYIIYDYNVDKTPAAVGYTTPSSADQRHNSDYYTTTNIYSTYTLSLKEKHNFMLLGGTQFENNTERFLRAQRTDLMVRGIRSVSTGIGVFSNSESLSHWATEGYFGRFTYNYKEKYLFETNARYDGTSRFRQGKRWGFFPSMSLGWNVHRESFWQPIENYINTFKLRGSYGSLGNQNVNPYQDLELIPLQSGSLNWVFNYGNARPIGYTSTPDLISPNLTWETITILNAGINLSFFKSRLQADFDVFERTTTDMIGPSEAKPGVLGSVVPRSNNSTLQTKGWELILRWKDNLKSGLAYYLDFNLYDSKAKVTSYFNPTNSLNTWYVGKEEGEIWGFQADDLYRSQEELDAYRADVNLAFLSSTWRTGDVKYLDTNGDGSVNNGTNTLDDPGDMSIIGNSTPHYQYGISAGINFKGFDFSMLWKGTGKRDLVFGRYDNLFWAFRTDNQSSVFEHHLDYFRDKPGDMYTGLYEGDANINLEAFWPRPYMTENDNLRNRHPSTRYMWSGAYARMQNVQIGYSLPNSLVSKLHFERLRIFVSGENLITISNLFKGLDPVALAGYGDLAGKTYGADRIYSLGILISY